MVSVRQRCKATPAAKESRGFDENEVVADRVVRELCRHGRALPPPAGAPARAIARL